MNDINSFNKSLNYIVDSIIVKLDQVTTQDFLDELHILTFGKKGEFTKVLKEISLITPETREKAGSLTNSAKSKLVNLFNNKVNEISKKYYNSLSENEYFDITCLKFEKKSSIKKPYYPGSLHPITLFQHKLQNIFQKLGFSITDGPQLELDKYNFEFLNFTNDHPARNEQDTFYINADCLLRTHTSSVQVRTMEKATPPLKIIAPGRVFRNEEIDASHEHTFYQMEGMVIDQNISISHLLFLMKTIFKEIFQKEVKVRLRPGYFPFVEPGFELDIECLVCFSKGCSVCKYSGWVELLPCGLIHSNVLKSGGLDTNKWQGLAFGLGVNRLVMMCLGIEDIRHFQEPNIEFLSKFKGFRF